MGSDLRWPIDSHDGERAGYKGGGWACGTGTALRPLVTPTPAFSRWRGMLLSIGRRVLGHNRALEAMLVWSQGAGAIAGIVIARSVGPPGRGTVVTLAVWGQILGWLAAFSLDKALVVLTSGPDRVASPDEGLRSAIVPVVGTSCIALIASVLLGHRFFSSNVLIIALAALAVATAQAELVAGWLLAKGRRQTFIVWRLLQPSIYVGSIIVAALVFRAASTQERTVLMGVGTAASMVVPVIFALALISPRPRIASRVLRPLIRFAFAAHAANILQYLNGRLDLLILPLMVAPGVLGIYSAGAALGQLAVFMASAGVVRGITGESKATDFIGLAVAILLAGIVIFASPLVIPLVFGTAFDAAVPIARILAIGSVANYALQAACGRLLGRRQPWGVVFSQGVGVVVFLVGIATFRTMEGVAWSSVVSFIAALAVAQVALRLTDEPVIVSS